MRKLTITNNYYEGKPVVPCTFKSISGMKKEFKNSSNTFFSEDTMRFWSSHIYTFHIIGRRFFFITSEKSGPYDNSPIAFTIREAIKYTNFDGVKVSYRYSVVSTFGFCAFDTLKEAKDTIREFKDELCAGEIGEEYGVVDEQEKGL